MKPVKIIFTFTVSFILLLSSCKKNDVPTVVKGDVLNLLTNQPVSNIPLIIYRCNQPILGKEERDSLTTVFTDTQGKYNYTLTAEKGFYYKIGIAKNDLVESTEIASCRYIDLHTENVISFFKRPLKTLQINVKVLRHDRNRLHIDILSADTNGGFWSMAFYQNINPLINFDGTYFTKIPEGRSYTVTSTLWNYVAPITYNDKVEDIKPIAISNTDTTKVDVIFP
ncbi:MAG: hypothetical protein IPP48_11075 [Chitinophagaceae bacterium]|nr:hypothetical protein [Chitinophagaceae bacterium]